MAPTRGRILSVPTSGVLPPSSVSRFLWFCAGADLELLARCPTDHPKYTGIGLTVFLTAILATISAGYLTYAGTNSLLLVAFFAPLWGTVILNLNRFVVLSMRLEQSTFKNVLIALPRVLIAFIISIVIMTPLQLRLFSAEISDYLRREAGLDITKSTEENKQRVDKDLKLLAQALDQEKGTLAKMISGTDPETADLAAKIALLEEEDRTQSAALSKLSEEEAKIRRELADEKAGRNGNPPGIGPAWKDIEARLKGILGRETRLSESLHDNRERLTRLQAERDAVLDRSSKEIKRLGDQISELRGRRQIVAASDYIGTSLGVGSNLPANDPAEATAPFLKQFRALHAITKQDRAVEWIALVLQLLMLLIEASPLVAKFLSPAGAYDKILVLEEGRIVSAYLREAQIQQSAQAQFVAAAP